MVYLAEHSLEAAQQLLAGRALTLEVIWTDQHGEPAAAGGAVTVTVTDAAGTSVLASSSATDDTANNTGRYTRALTVAQAGLLPTMLVATWTDGTSTITTYHELVGGVLFTVSGARLAEPDQLREDRYSDAELRAARRAVELEFEQIASVSFTRRYRRRRLSGDGTTTLVLPHTDREPAELRSCRVYDDATSYTSLTSTELAAVHLDPSGVLTRTDGNAWARGTQNLLLEYVVGLGAVPEAVRVAGIRRARQLLGESRSAVPFNAISWTPESGITYRLSTPGAARTGDPTIDAVLERYGHRNRPF